MRGIVCRSHRAGGKDSEYRPCDITNVHRPTKLGIGYSAGRLQPNPKSVAHSMIEPHVPQTRLPQRWQVAAFTALLLQPGQYVSASLATAVSGVVDSGCNVPLQSPQKTGWSAHMVGRLASHRRRRQSYASESMDNGSRGKGVVGIAPTPT